MASAFTSTLTFLALLAATSAHAGLVPGGGPSSSDCYLALDVEGVPTGSAQKGKTVVCTDGEPCDTGACGDDVCTVTVSGCVNQIGLPGCQPPMELKSAKIKGKLSINVSQLLQGGQCTPAVTGSIPAAKLNKKGKAKITKKNKLTLKGKAKAQQGTKPPTDSDTWTIQCVPRTTDCPPPTTTSTSVTIVTTTSTTTTTNPCGNGMLDAGEECDGAIIREGVCNTKPVEELTCSTECTILGCGPLYELDFVNGSPTGKCGEVRDGSGTVLKDLTCGGLNIGGGNGSTPEGPTPDGAINRYLLRCEDGNPTCTVNPTTGTPAPASTEGDCTTKGCNFGTPLPIEVPSQIVFSTCVVNKFAEPASGTVNPTTGEAELNVSLDSDVYLTGGLTFSGEPLCPKCIAGKCGTGASKDQPCASTNSDGYTRDCLPEQVYYVGTIPVNLSPLKTAAVTATAPDGIFCTNQANNPASNPSGKAGCFQEEQCRSYTETGVPAGPLTPGGTSTVTLASTFCIPATGNGAVAGTADLPGPGAVSLPGTFSLRGPLP